MSHDHHSHAPASFNRLFIIAISANGLYTLAQAVYAIHAHSMSLLADAGHNAGDVLGLLMAWGAAWLLTRPANERYSYGYKRTTILSALANSVLLVCVCLGILYEAIDALRHPVNIHTPIVMLVALIGIVVNAGTAWLFHRNSHTDLNMRGAFLHLLADACVSFAVVIGAIIIHFTQWQWIDPILGIVIALFIFYGTWALLRQAITLIMDGVPAHIQMRDVTQYLTSLPGVARVHDLHVWGLSTREVALTAHLVMPLGQLSDAMYHDICHSMRERFAIHHITLQVEKGDSEHPCHTHCGAC